MARTRKITLTRYGIAEVIKWCIDRNHKQIPGTDSAGFKRMQAELKAKPDSSDYFVLDQFWKKPVTFEFTEEEIHTIDRCLYDNPNAESTQNPAIRYRFWEGLEGASQTAGSDKGHS
jgi:hypothetical protein